MATRHARVRTPQIVQTGAGGMGEVYRATDTKLGRAGRREDATRLLFKLEDRGSRGEYVPTFAPLTILTG